MGACILIVEDEIALATFLKRYLGAVRPGDEVELATTVAGAQDHLATGHYDLLIVDHLLPDATGLSLLTLAKRQARPPQGILMTGLASPALKNAARVVGAAWLSKPFDLPQFGTLVAACLDGAAVKSQASLPPRHGEHREEEGENLACSVSSVSPWLHRLASE